MSQDSKDNLERYRSEKAASIASALDGGSDSVTDHQDPDDVEKAVSASPQHDTAQEQPIASAADWNGPDDPGNPQRWPLWKRCYHVAATAIFAIAVTIGSSLITPATVPIAKYFDVGNQVAILTLTLFVLGLGFGPLIAAPISETFGRSVVYKITVIPYILLLLGAGMSTSVGSLLACRTLAGIVGSPVLAVGAGTSADLFPQHYRAIASSAFVTMAFLGPALGPIIGGFVAQYLDFRWTQYVTIFFAVLALAFVMPMQETYKKIILSRRAKKLGIAGPSKAHVSRMAFAKTLLTITLIRPLNMLFTEPVVLFISLYNGFLFAVLYSFFAAYPYVFGEVYHFTTSQSGLTFVGIAIGVILGCISAIVFDQTVYIGKYRRALKAGQHAVVPEVRLWPAMIGSFGVPIGLFWFAWTARPSIHWISPVLAGIPFAFGNMVIFISGALYMIDVYGPLQGASSLAANGFCRYMMGAVLPIFTLPMYEHLGIDWAASLLGFISLAMLPIPWVLFKYGPKLRARSGYDTIKI